MKKLLLVALFIAIPALVLAQGTPTAPKAPEASKPAVVKTDVKVEPAKAVTETTTKKVESATTATTTKPAEVLKTTTTTPETFIEGEILAIDKANSTFTLVSGTNKEVISYKTYDTNLKEKAKVKAVYEKDNAGKLWLKKLEVKSETLKPETK